MSAKPHNGGGGGGGSVVGDGTRRQGEHGARHPGSCMGAAETDAGRVVSGAVRDGERTTRVGCA
jgi:hypothetical protein